MSSQVFQQTVRTQRETHSVKISVRTKNFPDLIQISFEGFGFWEILHLQIFDIFLPGTDRIYYSNMHLLLQGLSCQFIDVEFVDGAIDARNCNQNVFWRWINFISYQIKS